jgi:CheY-like chemotaxis protein
MAHVLVVDDDATIRELVAEALELEGYGAESAATGEGALGRVRALRPDLVLLDVALPTMDSPAFLEACRREPSCADVRIVLMTAAWDVERLAKVLGVSGSLPKPFGLHELSRVVEHALAE